MKEELFTIKKKKKKNKYSYNWFVVFIVFIVYDWNKLFWNIYIFLKCIRLWNRNNIFDLSFTQKLCIIIIKMIIKKLKINGPYNRNHNKIVNLRIYLNISISFFRGNIWIYFVYNIYISLNIFKKLLLKLIWFFSHN